MSRILYFNSLDRKFYKAKPIPGMDGGTDYELTSETEADPQIVQVLIEPWSKKD